MKICKENVLRVTDTSLSTVANLLTVYQQAITHIIASTASCSFGKPKNKRNTINETHCFDNYI